MKVVDVGLTSKLAGDGTLVAMLTDGTAIYQDQAPPGTARPYVIFGWAGGGNENINPSELLNFVYSVKGVSDVLETASDIAARVKTVLHKQSITVVGYTNFWLNAEGELRLTEVAPDGDPIYHRGAFYRIRLDD